MIEDRHVELIHADLDGELQAADRAELARILLAHPEARALRDELVRLFGALSRLDAVAPPTDLAPTVLSALGPARATQTAPVVRAWHAAAGLRYAAVFVGGLLVSAALLRLAVHDGDGPDVSQLVGTIGGHDGTAGQSPIDRAALRIAEVDGSMNTYLLGSQLVLELDVRARQPVEVVAAHGSQTVRFAFGTPPGSPERVLWLPTGHAESGSDIRIKVYASGELKHETSLGAARGNRS